MSMTGEGINVSSGLYNVVSIPHPPARRAFGLKEAAEERAKNMGIADGVVGIRF